MGKKCCVKGCKSKSFRNCGISFFQFPKDQALNRKWLRVVKGRISKLSVVCSIHFKPEEIVSNRLNSKNYLVANAVPSIFDMINLPPDPIARDVEPVETVSKNAKNIDNVMLRSIRYCHDNGYEKYRDFEDDIDMQYDEYDSYEQNSKAPVKDVKCKCCLGGGILKNMWWEHNSGDDQEEYGSMLIECFSLPWIRPDDLKNKMEHICQPCIQRLKNALSFRAEILASEKFLRNQLENIENEDVDTLQDELEEEEEEEDTLFDVTTEYLDYEYLDDGNDSDDNLDEFDKLKEDLNNINVEYSVPTCIEELPEDNGNQPALTFEKMGSKRKQQSREINNTESDREVSPAVKRIKQREISPTAKGIKAREISPALERMKEREIPPVVKTIKERAISPAIKRIKEREISPAVKGIKAREMSPAVKRMKEREIPPVVKTIKERGISPAIKRIQASEISLAVQRIKDDIMNVSNNTSEYDEKKASEVITHNKIIGCLGDVIRYSNATPIGGHTKDGFKCCYCRDQYDSPQTLKLHTLDKHADKVFVNTKEDHVKLDITNLKCVDCEASLSSLDELIMHLQKDHQLRLRKSIHYPIVPFKFDSEELQCAICHKEFQCFDMLSKHMNVHVKNQNKMVQRKLKVGDKTYYYAAFGSNGKNGECLDEENPEMQDVIEDNTEE